MWNLLLGLLSFWMSMKVTPQKIAHYLEAHGQNERNNLEFVSPETVRVACVQLKPQPCKTLSVYLTQMLEQAQAAVEMGAQIVVYPEYTGLLAGTLVPGYQKLLSWITKQAHWEDLDQIEFVPTRLTAVIEAFHNFFYEAYLYTFGNIARLQHIYVVAGTSLFYERGRLINRCVVFGPDGEPMGSQDKTSAIGFDRALGVTPSDQIEVITTAIGNLGIVIGSDAYYFECYQILKAKGAQFFAAPGLRNPIMPDLLRCRASEQGVYILYACLTSIADGEETSGTGIFAPLDLTLGRDGIVAEDTATNPGVVSSRINLEKLTRALEKIPTNPVFLAGDYLHSYRYCGAPPMGTL